MADLTDDAATAFHAVDPAIARHGAGIHSIAHIFGSGRCGQYAACLHQHGREAAVEANGQDAICSVGGRSHRVQFLFGESERFLHEHMLAGIERRDGELRMAVVTCGNEQGRGRGVIKYFAKIGRGTGKAELFGGADGAQPRGGDDRREHRAAVCRLDGWQEYGSGVIAHADEGDAVCGGSDPALDTHDTGWWLG